MGGRQPVSLGLVGLTGIAFVGTWIWTIVAADGARAWTGLWRLEDAGVLDQMGALVAARVWADGEWWRLVTAPLLHGSLLHWALNAWSIWVLAPLTEQVWGSGRQLLWFALSAVGACFASLAWAEAGLVVGASGGVFGLAGALWVVAWRDGGSRWPVLGEVDVRRLGLWLLGFLGLGFALPLLGFDGWLAAAGHLGGFLLGCGLGAAWVVRSRGMRVLHVVGVSAALSVGLYLALSPLRPVERDRVEGAWWLLTGEADRAIGPLERVAEVARDDERADVLNGLAYARALAGSGLERGRREVDEALALEPGNPAFLDTRGWIECRAGRVGAGLEAIRASLSGADGWSAEVVSHLAGCPVARVP